MSDIYKLVLNKPGYYQFTMPDGFESNVDVYTWGAGGGSGSGASGGGGGYAASNVAIPTGNVVSVVVGTRGGDASGPYPGSAGTGGSIGYNGGAGAYGGDPEDADAGGSGGGGGATAVLINGTAAAVAAGGGGGGGYGEDGAGGATTGYPGGTFVGQSTGYYQATHPRYCSFLNTYGVWGPFPTTVTINFPVTGTYTFYFSVDNYGSVVLDGTTTLFSVTGEFNYQTYYTTTHTVNSGSHTLTISPVNISGPASVGVQILNPSSVDIWNTLALLTDTGLTSTTNGQNGTQGGAGASGGGGGGLFGGETGVAYGDDGPGGQGGNGGQNYGDVTIAGTDQTSGGASLRSVFGLPPSTGNAGYDGYAILSFTRKMRMFNKVSGDWKSIQKIYYKSPVAGTLSNVLTKTFSTVNITSAPKPTTTFNTAGSHSFTVPADITSIDLSAIGGGGGGGGTNDLTGATGGSGAIVHGHISVNPGDTITVDVGGGGGYGYNASGSSGIGGAGGTSTLGYGGGNGGSETWTSSTGGGGGAATVVKLNSTVIAIAGGGGGGGGGGYNRSGGYPKAATGATVSGTAGENAPNPSGGDVDGGGGGGGGVNGGAGGAYGNGGTSGTDGTSFASAGFTVSAGAGANGGVAVTAGLAGSVVIQYSLPSVSGEAWTVPAGVKQLTVNYPTPDGLATKLFPVTVGETIIVTLGDFGVDSTIKGSAGTLTLPAYNKRVFTYSGNVDHIIAQDVSVATDTGVPVTASGGNDTITAAAAAEGIYYNVTYEGWHGDLGATISFTPALKSTIYQPVQVYTKNGSGRQYPGNHSYPQQPSADNNYVMNDYQGDYDGGEGSYYWETWLYQQGYISITYDQAYAPGTWIPVTKVFYKDGFWKPLTSNATINLTKLS